MKSWKTQELKNLANVLLGIKKETEMIHFLRDLCTLEELAEMSKRWQSVVLLDQGKSYRDIAKITGLSTTTVTRIAHWLNHGEGGYLAALKQLRRRR